MPTVIFPGRYESLAKIAELTRTAAQDAGLSDFDCYTVETSIDEACSNIIEHAYDGENKGQIEISYEITEKWLEFTLRDWGNSFDPEKVPTPDLECCLPDRKASGLGIYIMRQWMDEVEFIHKNGVNTAILRKYIPIKQE